MILELAVSLSTAGAPTHRKFAWGCERIAYPC
jgi:hypothetical protein